MLKSALTASLAGGAPAPAPPPVKKSTLDHAAFPCIPYADELDGVTTLEDELQDLNLDANFVIVGSAPTNLIMPDGTSLVSCPAEVGEPKGKLYRAMEPAPCAKFGRCTNNGDPSPPIGTQGDYAINPRRRRGGQETNPEMAASLVSCLQDRGHRAQQPGPSLSDSGRDPTGSSKKRN